MKLTPTTLLIASALTLAAGAVASDRTDDRDALEEARVFSSAIELAGFQPELSGDRPYTLFVPSDAALIGEGSAVLLEGVYTTPSNQDRLANLVGYHIIPGEKLVLETDSEAQIETRSGENLLITVRNDEIILNGQVRVTDTVDLGTGIAYVTSGLLWADLVYEEADENIQAFSTPIN